MIKISKFLQPASRVLALCTLLVLPMGASAFWQDRAVSEEACRQHAMPLCAEPNDTVWFSLRTGRQRAQVGTTDPIWHVNGVPANTVELSAWLDDNRATWISPATAGNHSVAAGEFEYTANIWFDQNPYLYDFVRTNLTIGADNQIVSVSVNGTTIYEGNGGNRDFDAYENVSHSDDANWPWVRGCNEIRVTVRNSGGPSGMTLRGGVRARCSRCLTERPPME